MKFAGKRFFAILKLTRGLQVVFLSLAILFFLLALGDITGNGTTTKSLVMREYLPEQALYM